MNRFITALGVALACAFALNVQAQETRSKTEVKGANTVTYTGCIENGTEARTFILDKAVPISRTTRSEGVGTSGAVTSTTTTYALVPDEKVELVTHVGHKVEVTGVMVPAGQKVETKTKVEREHGEDAKIKEKSKSDLPQFRVTSIKQLAERCE
jgi:hypothetical protein